MDWFANVDWDTILVPDTPLLEIFARGSLVYLALFLFLRFILKRQAGAIGMSDMLVIVLIADAAQNAMADDYKSVPDGVLLVATLIFWNWLLEWMGYHFTAMEKWLHPPALPLIKHGKMIRRNMQRELITKDELLSQLREQGIEDIESVKKACLEGDGSISIIKYDGEQHQPQEKAV